MANMTNSAVKGATAEAKAIAELTDMGYVCSLPIVHAAKYDLIVDIHDTLWRIQVKHSYPYDDVIRTDLRTRTPKGMMAYKRDEVDAFIIYSEVSDECYFFWFDELPSTGVKRPIEWYQEHKLQERLS